MHRRARTHRLAVLLLVIGLPLSGCGTEIATTGIPERSPTSGGPTAPPPPQRTPSTPPSPRPPKPTCPPSGASITVGEVDAALGHRAVVVKLTNCRAQTLTVNGYPDIKVLDAKKLPMQVKVTHGLSYMAIDPGPAKLRLHKGESVLAAASWANIVDAGVDKASGTYLSVAAAAGDHPTIWPVDTDLGTTAKVTLTAWCRKFPA
jgi:hypothetical protein